MTDQKINFDIPIKEFQKLWDREDPANSAWMQQEGEKDLWYSRFHDHFLLQGKGRTLSLACNNWRDEMGKERSRGTPTTWQTNSKKYQWKERAKAFDQAVEDIQRNIWSIRKAKIIDVEWEIADKMLDRLNQMLAFPLEEKKTKTVNKKTGVTEITIIKPMKWSQTTAVTMAKAISELYRLSAGMPTNITETEEKGEKKVYLIPSNGREAGLEPTELENDNDNKATT